MILTALGLSVPSHAYAQQFDVPAGPLGKVAAAVGSQAGITLVIVDPSLAVRRSPGVRGRHSLRSAITIILRGTGGEAIFFDERTVRIVRRREAPQRPSRPKPTAPPPALQEDVGEEIVVTATKQPMLLQRYPGSAMVIDLDEDWLARNASGGTSVLGKLLPILGSTNLGPARNKLFLRGIADSSFNGPTQATVGQYLGDTRLTYNAPDPNLNLYDMKRVEVLSGPQGTLYGAASLGGIIRLVPNVPDITAVSASIGGGTSVTDQGGVGGDVAAMVNLPLARDRAALRFVGYVERETGYIDDPLRGRSNINGTRVYGMRGALRAESGSGWTLDAGVVIQNTLTRDGQYTLRGDPPLTRRSVIAQPFRNNYRLGYFTARRSMGKGELVSTTAVVRHDLGTIFDATGHDGTGRVAEFEERNGILLASHETRLSGGGEAAPWVAGVAAFYTISGLSRRIGAPSALERITGVVNEQTEAALFGQFSRPFTPYLTATLGIRVTYANSGGRLVNEVAASEELHRVQLRRSGTIAVEWHPRDNLSIYYRYQQGYRAGGLAVAPAGSSVAGQRFLADDLDLNEIGVRLRDPGNRFSLRAALFHAGWANIQADLIDISGLPCTANIGYGLIVGLEGEASWRPNSELKLNAAAFLNRSRLYAPEPQFARSQEQTLPNVAENGVRVAASWRREIWSGATLASDISIRYVGPSRLGVGPLFEFSQGNYLTVDAGARLDLGRLGFSLNLTNLSNVRGNSFAFGNPFSLAQGNQVTPLRPRSIRLGIDARF